MSAPPDFASLGLPPALAQAAQALGWTVPTAIQAAALPPALKGRDLLGLAPTGTGKTGAFLLPLLQRVLQATGRDIDRPRRLRGLVLAPTRELAAQTFEAAQALAPQLKAVLAVGGLSINPQMMALRGGAHLVVATPGRLLDLLAHNALRLDDLAVLVLDEADRLLDLGFADELARLLLRLPGERQTLLFTATWPEGVATLARAWLHNPLQVQADGIDAADGTVVADGADGIDGAAAPAEATAAVPLHAVPAITQRALVVDSARRTPLLRQLLQQGGWRRVMVFVATQYAADHVADKLRQAGVPAAAFHGDLSAGRRRQVLDDLASGALGVVVATDLAARGIDVPGLEVVVNHDLPRSAVDYTHRIGRTGRAGAAGLAISFVCADAPGSEAHFRLIEKRQAQRVPRERVAGFEPAAPAPPLAADASGLSPAAPAADPHGGLKGRRKSKKDKLREAAARGAKP